MELEEVKGPLSIVETILNNPDEGTLHFESNEEMERRELNKFKEEINELGNSIEMRSSSKV
jgi:hypothetical protein